MEAMPPLALVLIDAVFALAYHHDRRAREAAARGEVSLKVHAQVAGPQVGDPAPGGMVVRVSIGGDREESHQFWIDFDDERLLAPDLALAELPLSRGGVARLLGELESWCYEQIPMLRLESEGDGESTEAK